MRASEPPFQEVSVHAAELKKELDAPADEFVKLAREELGEMSTRRLAEGFVSLKARSSPDRGRVRLVLGLAAVLVVASAILVGRHWIGLGSEAPLSYAVEGGTIDSNGAVSTMGKAQPILRFSDGTEVVFVGGARGRIQSVGGHGARIALKGRVDVAVVPWHEAEWLFDAGPFLIKVTGTTFTADWREADERLEVVLRTGSVSVSGPLSDGAITLRAGQWLTVSARKKEVIIRSIDAVVETNGGLSVPPTNDDGTKASTPATPAEHSAPPIAAPRASASSAPGSNWASELAAGHFASILQQAEQRGLDAVLARGSSDELAALSDAARYSRREDVARRALVAQRRRFPGSTRANDAAFLLGRLEEAAGRPEAALEWYERCLTELPHGTYAPEALGRKMTIMQRVHGDARARPLAEEYLRRFGDGTYAAAARALLRAP